MAQTPIFSVLLFVSLLVVFWTVGSVPVCVCSATQLGIESSYPDEQLGNLIKSYSNNYITAIEDRRTHLTSFFVASTDHNYALVSPSLAAKNWSSISVNGNEVFIIKKEKDGTKSVHLEALSLGDRDFIAEIRSSFTQNLAGLKFAKYASGRGLVVNSNTEPANKTQESATRNGGLSSRPHDSHLGPQNGTQRSGLASSARSSTAYNGQCDASNFEDANYYNLLDSPLKKCLAGDIYYFDFNCNALDIYSSSVSVRRKARLSLLYRDHSYFSFASANLPLSINRFFLVGEWLLIVYNDSTVVAKPSWMLVSKELEMVIQLRNELRQISGWQERAAKLTSALELVSANSSAHHERAGRDQKSRL